MENHNLSGVVRDVVEDTGLTPEEARAATQAVLDSIGRAVLKGSRVKLGNFGSFIVGSHHYNVVHNGVRKSGTSPVVRFSVSGLLRSTLRSGGSVSTLRRSPKTR